MDNNPINEEVALINSANQMDASKYFSFDDNLSYADTFIPDHRRNRVYEYYNKVADRQYEMDVRRHQEDLENSAYQRAVADMKKAGLNPYWMFNNSAGTVASSDVHEASSSKNSKSDKKSDVSDMFKSLIKIISSAAIMALL